jgi:hypothetical protein
MRLQLSLSLGNDYGNTAQLRRANMTHSRSVVDTGLRENCKYCGVQLVVRNPFNCEATYRRTTKTNEDAVQSADSPTIRWSIPHPSSGWSKLCANRA